MKPAILLCLFLAVGSLRADVLGTVSSKELNEISGLAASRKQPGILWVHNDSGDRPRVFALKEDGSLLATYVLKGAEAKDWEDIAIGPGPEAGRDYLYLADFGNNCECRTDLVIYRIPEPQVPAKTGKKEVVLEAFERFPFQYPDRKNNAEALLVDPRDGGVYIVSKVDGNQAKLYQFPAPLSAGQSVTVTAVGSLKLPIQDYPLASLVTGGDIAPDGGTIALNTYTHSLLWKRGPKESVAKALKRKPVFMQGPLEPWTEALGFSPDSRSYYLVSEANGPQLYRFPAAELPASKPEPALRGLVDDFEDGDLTNGAQRSGLSYFSGTWFGKASGEKGPAGVTLSVETDGGSRALRQRLILKAGASADGLVLYTGLSADWGLRDLLPAKGLRFKIRSDVKRFGRVFLEGAIDGKSYGKESAFVKALDVSEAWQDVILTWSDFSQPKSCPGAACLGKLKPSAMMLLGWDLELKQDRPGAELWLDDIRLVY